MTYEQNLIDRITYHLSSGGLFNPELADHLAVRNLLMECREALAQPEPFSWAGDPSVQDYASTQPEQEPVAWMKVGGMKAMPALEKEAWLSTGREFDRQCVEDYTIPLYTSPPQRKPLSFEQVEDCFPEGAIFAEDDGWLRVSAQTLHDIARAIEAAHGIKGEA